MSPFRPAWWRVRIVVSPLNVRDPSSPSFWPDREKGSEALSPVAIVWPCPLAVDAYAAAGRDVGFPRPACPSCAGPLVFWLASMVAIGHPSGHKPLMMDVRQAGQAHPNSLFRRGVSRLLREPLAGTTAQTLPGTLGHLRAWFSQFKCMNQRAELGAIRAVFRLTSEGSLVRTQLRPPGQSSKDGASPAETRSRTAFFAPAGYGCSRLTATGCAQYAPKSVGPCRRRCHQRAAWSVGS